jgi:hypothetical protein
MEEILYCKGRAHATNTKNRQRASKSREGSDTDRAPEVGVVSHFELLAKELGITHDLH